MQQQQLRGNCGTQLKQHVTADDHPDVHHLAQMKTSLTPTGSNGSFLIDSNIHLRAVTRELGLFDFHSAVKEDTSRGDVDGW